MQKEKDALRRIRKVADYQLGKGTGEALFPNSVTVRFSKQTGRIRHMFLEGNLLATLRPTDGMFSLTVHGAKRLVAKMKPLRQWVRVQNDAAPFIATGKSVFAKHVADADNEIRPKEEVIVLDEMGKVLAVGKAVLTGREMKAFKCGVAVRVRRGAKEKRGEG